MLKAGDPATPLFYPTVFIVEQRRSAGLAENTLWRDEQALITLLLWADSKKIDLEARFSRGDFLSSSEVASFARAAQKTLPNLRTQSPESANNDDLRQVLRPSTKLETFRCGHVPTEIGVGKDWESYRLWLARAYLTWLADKTSPYQALSDAEHVARCAARDAMGLALTGHIGGGKRGSTPKEGLTDEQQVRLLDIIRPDSPENPWPTPFVRARNKALITFLLALGPRKGEALKQKVRHLNMGRLEVSIVRGPDDPDDDRRLEPNVKRAGRDVPMDEDVADLLCDYINDWRGSLPGAPKTDFLFLTISGKPMSHEAVHKIFTTLRNQFPELPSNLSAHLLRHTWNDNYSVVMDQNKVNATDEIRTRSYLMGWKSTSGTAAKYTKRSTRKRAAAHSKESQGRLMRPQHGNAK